MAGVWTRNYYNLLTALILGNMDDNTATTPSDYTPPIKIRGTNGTYYTAKTCEANNPSNYPKIIEILKNTQAVLMTNENQDLFSYSSYCTFMFGNGSAALSYDDYKLGNAFSSNLTYSGTAQAQASAFDSDTHEYSSAQQYTFTNGTSSNITVTEMGIYIPYRNNNNDWRPALVYRELFDSPIVLAPGESIIVTGIRNGEVFNYTPY